MDIKLVNAPRCGDIAESFQRWADQGGAAGAIIHKLQFWRELESTPRDAGVQVGHLALNRPGFLLHIRGDAGIDGRVGGAHGSFLSACGALGEITGAGTARRRLRCRTGTSWAYACWRQACSRRLGSNMLCTSNGARVLPGLVAMGFHAIPWECAFAGRMTTERRALKPLPVGGAKAAARDVLLQLKLYQLFCNIVGGVISPLLANVALHGIEDDLQKAYTKKEGIPRLVRYADDFVVLHPTEAGVRKAQELIEGWLKGIGLELKPSKTQIVHSLQGKAGFDFLGFNVRQYRVGKSTSGKAHLGFKTLIKPSKDAILEHMKKIRKIVRDHKSAAQVALIDHLNPVVSGWSNYYKTVVSKDKFSWCDYQMYLMLTRWVRSRHRKSVKKASRKYWDKTYSKHGWTFRSPNNAVLVWHTETMIERHVKVKGHNSPYNGDLVYWAARLKDHPMVRTREGRLIRDQKGRCAHCGMMMRPGDLVEIDHIVPKRPPFYGKDVYRNLQAIHGHCHDQKTAQFDQPGESIVSISTEDNGNG